MVRLTVQRSDASGGETQIVRDSVERETIAVHVVVKMGEVSTKE